MQNSQPDAQGSAGYKPGAPADDQGAEAGAPTADPAPHTADAEDPSLTEDIAALIDSGRNYAEAELAFQKTRASLAASNTAKAAAALVLALVLLHIALVALAVGAVIALAPLITIWGAIAVVVGAMLLGVGLLVRSALKRASLLSAIFSAPGDKP